MFKIVFIKDDEVLTEKMKKGDVAFVSRSIRDKKVSSGIAKDYVEEEKVATEPKKKGK